MNRFNVFLESKKRSEFEILKKNKVSLTDDERKKAFEKKAIWNPSNLKNPVSAIWKSKNSNGDFTYVTNTHRVYQTAKTIDGAINKFHNVVKQTS